MHLRNLPSTEQHEPPFVEEDDGRERLLLVEAGSRLYAMNVSNVREVLRARAITRVPGTPSTMLGLVNVRGMVVTVLDLLACVRKPPTSPAAPKPAGSAPVGFAPAVTEPRAHSETVRAQSVTETRGESEGSIVLLEHGSCVVGLAVQAVRDVRPLDDTAMVANAALGTADQFAAGTVQGLASAGGDVVVLLDVAALLTRHLISLGET